MNQDYRNGNTRTDERVIRNHSRLVTGNLLNYSIRDFACAGALRRHFGFDIEDCQLLEVGCGHCGHLITMQRFGIRPENLHGIDILERSIERARQRYPLLDLRVADAAAPPMKTTASTS